MEYQVRATYPGTMDAFTRAYLECAEWAGLSEEDRESLDAYDGRVMWSPDTLASSVLDTCATFQEEHAAALSASGLTDEQAGHDFFLTRNRHGAGFWDRGLYRDLGRRLTDAAHAWGSTNVSFDAETGFLTED